MKFRGWNAFVGEGRGQWSAKGPESGVLGIGDQGVRGGQGCQAWWDIVVRATVPELLLWGHAAQTHPRLPRAPPTLQVLWPALMDSNAYSRGGRAEDSCKPRLRQDLPLDIVPGAVWVPIFIWV